MKLMPVLYRQWALGPPSRSMDLNCSILVTADVNPGQLGLSLRWDRDTCGLQFVANVGPAEVSWLSAPVGPDRDEPPVEIDWTVAGWRFTVFRARRHLGLTTRWHLPEGFFKVAWFWMGLAVQRDRP